MANESNSTATVVVGCKLPHGLIMEIYQKREVDEPVMGGGTRRVPQFFPTGERHVLNGWAHPQNEAPRCQIVEGVALTMGIPKAFWEQWSRDNKDAPFLKNGLIFAHDQKRSVEDMSKERAKTKSGLERLDRDKLPRGIKNYSAAKEA